MVVLDPAELAEIRAILRSHLASEVRVHVFGSRAGGRVKPYSDLDLVLEAGDILPLPLMAELREAFDESGLRFKVDLVDRRSVDPAFGAIIDAAKVPLSR